VHSVSDLRQIEVHIAEPLVPDSSLFVVEIAIAKLKKHKSPGSDEIPAELIQAEGETFLSEIHNLVNYIFNKEELTDPWKEPINLPIYNKRR
jgi:hypothetical protein